ncbi:MAG: hypothetical protein WBA12_12415 [Catalinimonas sp.]
MYQTITWLLLLLGGSVAAQSTGTADTTTMLRRGRSVEKSRPAQEESGVRYASDVASPFNLKLMPGLFWNTLGLEAEVAVSGSFTVGVAGWGKWAPLDARRENLLLLDQPYHDPGYLVEVLGRYYPLQPAPSGWYVQANATWGNLLYTNAATRPFTFLTLRDLPNGGDLTARVAASEPYAFGVGSGYQFLIPAARLIVNLTGGAQVAFEGGDRSGAYVFFYAQPSVGLYF